MRLYRTRSRGKYAAPPPADLATAALRRHKSLDGGSGGGPSGLRPPPPNAAGAALRSLSESSGGRGARAGAAGLRAAIANLRADFDVVGVMEEMEAFLALVALKVT